jgi:uroporphyrinogen decarboxylase
MVKSKGGFVMIDSMTPKERLKAIAENRPYDRIPHAFAMGDAASGVTGVKVSEFYLDAKKQIEATVAAYRTYGLDSVSVRIQIEEVLGATVDYPDHSSPFISKPLNFEGDQIENLVAEDPKKHPKLQTFWQVLDGLFEAVGDEAFVSVTFRAPFSGAGTAGGTEKLMRGIIRKPEHVHRLLEKILAIEISIVDALKGYDVNFGISDPVASGTMIAAEQFRKFAKPYQKRLFAAMENITGRKPQIHICGDTAGILRDMAETGAGSISVDDKMDLDYVIDQVGADAIVVGNVKPSGTMLLGTPLDVENDLRSCLKKGLKAPGGYLPAFGCGLPINTPAENLSALFEALRKYGKYPINPDLL